MKYFLAGTAIALAALSGGVLVRYAGEQITALRFVQTAQLASVIQEPINRLTDQLINPQQKEVTLLFVGDLMLSRAVGKQMEKFSDFRYPFLKIADTLRSADFTFGNLEGPISSRGKNQGSIYSFRADPRAIEGLVHAGFDALSLANNHISDWGKLAVEDTINLLRRNNIRPVGAGMNYDDANAARIVEIGDPPAGEAGLKLALFAYTNLYPITLRANGGAGISDFTFANIRDRIRAIREQADIIAVSLHWGEEYAPEPTPWQRGFARSLIDAGADLIIGHHPHVVQEVERYNNGIIAYSLGNFVFDQNFSEATRRGAMLKVTVRDRKIVGAEVVAIRINDTFQAELAVP